MQHWMTVRLMRNSKQTKRHIIYYLFVQTYDFFIMLQHCLSTLYCVIHICCFKTILRIDIWIYLCFFFLLRFAWKEIGKKNHTIFCHRLIICVFSTSKLFNVCMFWVYKILEFSVTMFSLRACRSLKLFAVLIRLDSVYKHS